ncbi:MAG TPA: carbamoyltransferase C-terminal domain-containing protein [Haliangium sp.]|nr:carbamoyltransferase C-terminal domain-containing protein [Haliangium sp.]
MNILGLHFGHDAAATVVSNGRVVAYVLRERHARIKHAVSLDIATIDRALREAGIDVRDIDRCALSSTQGVELIIDDPAALAIEIGGQASPDLPCPAEQALTAQGTPIAGRLSHALLDSIYGEAQRGSWLREAWLSMFPEHKTRRREELAAVGWLDNFVTRDVWEQGRTLADLAAARAEISDELKLGFHVAASVQLHGRTIPAYLIHHHLAHAASSYYASGFDEAAILTHDGYSDGLSYHSGMFYYAKGPHIFPLGPNHLTLGGLYDRVGVHLGLGVTGPAGKLMGLAGYGKPRFFDARFVGNFHDHAARFKSDIASAWLYHCVKQARHMGYDMTHYQDPAHATDPINADIAASTQKLFEEIRLRAIEALYGSLQLGRLYTPNLCLSGGTALNCPSNTKVLNEGPFRHVYVEPACDDGGLAIGAALALYHSLYGNPLIERSEHFSPYLGVSYGEDEVLRALHGAGGAISHERCQAPGKRAAEDLGQNRVIGWFEGSSEAGPRALGHRSVLADPTRADNWPRVNLLKGREMWRPLAPAVLAEEAGAWFSEAPTPSPYMLFNARVRSSRLPAVTHVDGTARIQTVDPSCGEYYRVIRHFFELTGVPVVMNTSFNGPGEPIVETPAEALRFFMSTELDALYLDGYRVTRMPR